MVTFLDPVIIRSHVLKPSSVPGDVILESFASLQVIEGGDDKFWSSLGLKPFFHRLEKEEILYVPTGHLLVEKTGASSMIYGARKSFIVADSTAASNYAACKELLAKDGKDVEKMEKVHECLKAALQAAAAVTEVKAEG